MTRIHRLLISLEVPFALAVTAIFALCMLPTELQAQDLRIVTKKAAYDDVKFDLTNAIAVRGLVVDYNGFVDKMLARTGADLGSTKPIYKSAEFFTFCSARLSRAMMEVDPANIGFCPYVVFVYETANQPGTIQVGYRRPAIVGSKESQAALAEIDKLLEGIIRDAVK